MRVYLRLAAHALRLKIWTKRGKLGSENTYLPMLDRSRKARTYNAVTSGTIRKSILRMTFFSVSGRTWCSCDGMVASTSLPRTWLFSRSRGREMVGSLTGLVLVAGGARWYLVRNPMLAEEPPDSFRKKSEKWKLFGGPEFKGSGSEWGCLGETGGILTIDVHICSSISSI